MVQYNATKVYGFTGTNLEFRNQNQLNKYIITLSKKRGYSVTSDEEELILNSLKNKKNNKIVYS